MKISCLVAVGVFACILQTTWGTNPDCGLPPDSGPCYGLQPRAYYDASEGICKDFIYGGCGGNGNNFEKMWDCESDCSGFVLPPDCVSSPDPGSCYGRHPRTFYDVRDGKCKEFIYSGCGGNRNNFETVGDCQLNCGGSSDEPKAWREDLRCGGGYTAPNGEVAQCDPNGIYPCCSTSNWCGNTAAHCTCGGCIDYSVKAWREDLRCGEGYTAPNGEVAQCNPNGEYPCCSTSKWCGNTAAHCTCAGCVNYSG